jgi:GTP-binding protein HflX
VLVSALSGYGMDVLRARLATLLAELWEEVDVKLPYSEGELLSRVRERGTVDIGYRARDVRVRGRVTPTLASELRAASFGHNGRNGRDTEPDAAD